MEHNDTTIKSLISIIDETLGEVEEIRKTRDLEKSKFEASEIKLGEDEGLAGKSKNGELDAKKKEDEDKDKDKDKDEDKYKDMDKGENEKADADHGKFAQAPTVSKGENEKADPDHGKFAQAPSVSKGDDEDKDKDKDEDKYKDKEKMDYKDMKKSLDENESLMKSYVDNKMSSIEEKLSKMAAAIEAIADAPVDRKSIPAGVSALHKSADEIEPMNKAEIANKLFELKKSGEDVDSTDIFMVETGNQTTANQITTKYGLK